MRGIIWIVSAAAGPLAVYVGAELGGLNLGVVLAFAWGFAFLTAVVRAAIQMAD